MSKQRHLRLLFVALGVVALLAAGCSSDSDSDSGSSSTTKSSSSGSTYEGVLNGTFGLTAAECASGAVTAGSYFRMVQAGGDVTKGPFIENADSKCGDKTYTALTPGTDGGLVTGSYQKAPDPAFDSSGNATAAAIFEPVTFFAVAFGGATDPNENQPVVNAQNGTLSGDLSAFTAYYGGGSFNQGAPKPGESVDGPTGTIDQKTGDYSLDWTSVISGGSFDGFIGVWHFEGTYSAK